VRSALASLAADAQGFRDISSKCEKNVVRMRDRDGVLWWGPFSSLTIYCSHQGVLWCYGLHFIDVLARIVYASP